MFTLLFVARNKDFLKGTSQQQHALPLTKPDDWSLPSAVFFDPATQERLFHHLTGPYMGENARRGFPYKWLPTHLADAHGAISPRSFQIAIRAAAQHTEETDPDCLTAIGYKSLYAGVRQASDQRVREMAEAYAWIELLMQPLADQKLVPLDFAEIEDIWLDQGTLDHQVLQRVRLNNAEAAKEALTSLGVVRPMSTGKYDMPDIYRLQFRLGRRGGIPLPSRAVGVDHVEIHYSHRLSFRVVQTQSPWLWSLSIFLFDPAVVAFFWRWVLPRFRKDPHQGYRPLRPCHDSHNHRRY